MKIPSLKLKLRHAKSTHDEVVLKDDDVNTPPSTVDEESPMSRMERIGAMDDFGRMDIDEHMMSRSKRLGRSKSASYKKKQPSLSSQPQSSSSNQVLGARPMQSNEGLKRDPSAARGVHAFDDEAHMKKNSFGDLDGIKKRLLQDKSALIKRKLEVEALLHTSRSNHVRFLGEEDEEMDEIMSARSLPASALGRNSRKRAATSSLRRSRFLHDESDEMSAKSLPAAAQTRSMDMRSLADLDTPVEESESDVMSTMSLPASAFVAGNKKLSAQRVRFLDDESENLSIKSLPVTHTSMKHRNASPRVRFLDDESDAGSSKRRVHFEEDDDDNESASVRSLMSNTSIEMEDKLKALHDLGAVALAHKKKSKLALEAYKRELDKVKREHEQEWSKLAEEKNQLKDQVIKLAVEKTGLQSDLQKSLEKVVQIEQASIEDKDKIRRLTMDLGRMEQEAVQRASHLQTMEDKLHLQSREVDAVRDELTAKTGKLIALEVELDRSNRKLAEYMTFVGCDKEGNGPTEGRNDMVDADGIKMRLQQFKKLSSESLGDVGDVSEDDYDAAVRERDRLIDALEKSIENNQAVITKLRNDLIRLSVTQKEDEYVHRTKQEKLLRENAGLVIKVELLESELSRHTCSDDEPDVSYEMAGEPSNQANGRERRGSVGSESSLCAMSTTVVTGPLSPNRHRNQIKTLKATIVDLEKTNTSLQKEKDMRDAKIESLQSNVTELQNMVEMQMHLWKSEIEKMHKEEPQMSVETANLRHSETEESSTLAGSFSENRGTPYHEGSKNNSHKKKVRFSPSVVDNSKSHEVLTSAPHQSSGTEDNSTMSVQSDSTAEETEPLNEASSMQDCSGDIAPENATHLSVPSVEKKILVSNLPDDLGRYTPDLGEESCDDKSARDSQSIATDATIIPDDDSEMMEVPREITGDASFTHEHTVAALKAQNERLQAEMQCRLTAIGAEKRMKEEELQTKLQCREATILSLERSLIRLRAPNAA